jgi:penicillin-binding protein 1A
VSRLARRILIVLSVVLLVTALGTVASVAGLFWYHGRALADIDEDALRNHSPPQVTRVLASDGSLIGEIYSERRTVIAYEDIPSHVEDAFLAAEDADFYEHEGMDYLGMVRALVANVRAGEVRQGASTITQQVVKNFLLSPERTLERKVQELILARRLEQVLGKREILQLYLNDIYLGHGRYGIEEASFYYFGKSVREVDLGQAALLASLPKAPSRGSPFKDRDGAKARQVYVLRQMGEKGMASPADVEREVAAALEEKLRDPAKEDGRAKPISGCEEFVDLAHAELLERYGQEGLDRLGATVWTTVDPTAQRAAKQSVRDGLVALDLRRGFGHRIAPAKPKNATRALEQGKGPLTLGRIAPIIIDERMPGLPEDGFPGHVGEHRVFVRVPAGSRYDEPDVDHLVQFPAGGITMARILVLEPPPESGVPSGWALAEIGSGPEAAVVVAEVETGRVLAMVGGYGYERGEFNRVTSARRQPGSAFKPVIYGAALKSGTFTAASIVTDSPEIYASMSGKPGDDGSWKPTNFERDVYRGDIRLRVALTHSVNTVAIKLLDAVGFAAVHEFAEALGIESPLSENLSLALGTSEVTPFELLRGYMTLARGGSRIEPIVVERIEVKGRVEFEAELAPEQSIASEVAFVLTSMMKSVVEEGTGTAAKKLKRPVAGKTGTSADNRDAWFAGFTPDHVAVAWVGFDVPKHMRGETGGRAAVPIWLGAVQAVVSAAEPRDFVPPASVTVRTIDKASGLLAPTGVALEDGTFAPPDPETTMEEFFVAGTEPIEAAVPAALPTDDLLMGLVGDTTPETPEPSGEDQLADDAAPDEFEQPTLPPAEPAQPELPSVD